MSPRLLACALPLLALSCGKQEEAPRRPRGLSADEAPQGSAATTQEAEPEPAPRPATAPSSLPSPFVNAAPNPGALRNEAASPGSGADDAAVAGPTGRDAAAERDLARELAILIGQPISCVDLAAVVAGGGRVDIAVSAQVVPSGRITRAEATAKGQPDRALRCVEQLATSRSLRGPVPDAPRRVSTTVSMQVVATPP
jgi:hypothetical protein